MIITKKISNGWDFTLFENIKGTPTNFIPNSPNSVVQYIEAHDNATLHDIIAISMNYSTQNQSDIRAARRIQDTYDFKILKWSSV